MKGWKDVHCQVWKYVMCHVQRHAHTLHALILILLFNPTTNSSPATQVAKHLHAHTHTCTRNRHNKTSWLARCFRFHSRHSSLALVLSTLTLCHWPSSWLPHTLTDCCVIGGQMTRRTQWRTLLILFSLVISANTPKPWCLKNILWVCGLKRCPQKTSPVLKLQLLGILLYNIQSWVIFKMIKHRDKINEIYAGEMDRNSGAS